MQHVNVNVEQSSALTDLILGQIKIEIRNMCQFKKSVTGEVWLLEGSS
jgi:hypothetical protein